MYVVTGPLVYVKTPEGTVALQHGEAVPEGVSADRIDTLLHADAIAEQPEAEQPEQPEAPPAPQAPKSKRPRAAN